MTSRDHSADVCPFSSERRSIASSSSGDTRMYKTGEPRPRPSFDGGRPLRGFLAGKGGQLQVGEDAACSVVADLVSGLAAGVRQTAFAWDGGQPDDDDAALGERADGLDSEVAGRDLLDCVVHKLRVTRHFHLCKHKLDRADSILTGASSNPMRTNETT